MKKNKSTPTEIEYEIGSGNVFEDLKFENPEEEQSKSELTAEIVSIIKKKKLTQVAAAKILGVDQPRVSSLLKGNLTLFSIQALMKFLNALGQDIDLVVKPKPLNRNRAHLNVYTSSSERSSTPMAAKSK